MLRRVVLTLLPPLLVLLASPVASSPGAAPAAPAAVSELSPSTLRVASANIREGSLLTPRADRRDGTDRRRFAHRLLSQDGRLPDVVLLQESLGAAGTAARTLTAHPRARRLGARYAVITPTRRYRVAGACDGRRVGRFLVLGSSAILVNVRTVRDVVAAGTVRTWGRWHRPAWRHTGRLGHGCTAHPWARIVVRQPGRAARTAVVTNVHLAPVGSALKNRAVRVLQRDHVRRVRPGHLSVLGGDFNVNRCRVPFDRGEPRHCAVRAPHARLHEAGFRDVVRNRLPDGPRGVVGVARRIDLLYSEGPVRTAWHDRCYRAHLVRRWRCPARAAVFDTAKGFQRCEARSLNHGRPGGGCPPRQFRRYYSDHPILLGTVG